MNTIVIQYILSRRSFFVALTHYPIFFMNGCETWYHIINFSLPSFEKENTFY